MGSSLRAACILLGLLLLLLRRRRRAVSEGAVACQGPGQTQASDPAAGREPRAGPLRALFAQGKASRARREEIGCLFFVGSPHVVVWELAERLRRAELGAAGAQRGWKERGAQRCLL